MHVSEDHHALFEGAGTQFGSLPGTAAVLGFLGGSYDQGRLCSASAVAPVVAILGSCRPGHSEIKIGLLQHA